MPALRFDSLDLVPEGLREHAKKVDGEENAVTINVVASAKVDEFRDNNINLSKERDELLGRVETLAAIVGEDPEAFREELEGLRTTNERVQAGELKESRALEEAVGKRTEEMRTKYEERLSQAAKESGAWKNKYDALDQKHRQQQVAAYLREACADEDIGVVSAAIPDIIARGQQIFRADDQGRISAQDGDTTIYGEDGVSSMSGKEWLKKLREQSPFFFERTGGGDAGGETTQQVNGVDKGKIKAMTAQERLELANDPKGYHSRNKQGA